jgi:serine/threonine protein phosphatase PrpC
MEITGPSKWTSYSRTHTGNVRENNEDALYVHSDENLWIVADGMGGHSSGQFASQKIVDYFHHFITSPLFGLNIKKIKFGLQSINNMLVEMAKNKSDIIGSTIALLFIQDQYCACLWVGDSRIYRFRNNILKQLTRDHSQTEELIEMGLDLEDCDGKYGSNIITRAIGANQKLQVECQIKEIEQGDIYLLCSDGLNKELNDKEISHILASYPLEKSVSELLNICLQKKASDNITLIGTTCYSG